MNSLLSLTLTLALLGFAGAVFAQTRPLLSFDTEKDRRIAQANSTRITPVPSRFGRKQSALQIEFQPAEWPNVTFRPVQPWDWRGRGALALEITNPGSDAIEFMIRVDDDPGANGVTHCRTGTASLEAGKRATFVFRIGDDPMRFGMRGLPKYAAQRMEEMQINGTALNYAHIVAFQIFLHNPPTPRTLIIENVRLIPYQASLDKIVDRFGQYAHAEWPGKIKAEEEFATRRIAEENELKARPELPNRDRFGGWSNGPKLRATGFFRTEQYGGKWALVTPEGHLFLSLGMDCVNQWFPTFVTGRETMFAWLPEKGDPLEKHFGYSSNVHSGPIKEGRDFNFYTANLQRKYGADYTPAWKETALARLRAWGFNTIANWSDEGFHRNGKVPYVATAHIEGDHARVASGQDYWGKMHDPFDPRFAESVARTLRPLVARVKGDAWCLGYFVDNELSWGGWGDDGGRYGLALGALNADAKSSPAKRALIEQLKARYAEIARLNAAWKTDFADWDALAAPYRAPEAGTTERRADFAAFVKALAQQYFRIIADYLKANDPQHLYLGCRFAWRTPEAIEASTEFCDVVSFNIYEAKVDAERWAFLKTLGKPCIIGEFHFGALDRGMFHTGLVAANDQKHRAKMYEEYVRSVADHPALVGCHWFQYGDEPLTGRTLDGENYNIGFITVTDTPYPEMVAAAKRVHAEVYKRRWKAASSRQ